MSNLSLIRTVHDEPSSVLQSIEVGARETLVNFNNLNTLKRLDRFNKDIQGVPLPPSIGLKHINGAIETVMASLLAIPFIETSPESPTPHYKHYSLSNISSYNKVPKIPTKLIALGSCYIWSGMYGTPLYELFFTNNRDHYTSISQLSREVINVLADRLSKTSNTSVLAVMSNLSKSIHNDLQEADISLYRFPVDYIYSYVSYLELSNLLNVINYVATQVTYETLKYRPNDQWQSMLKHLYRILIDHSVVPTRETYYDVAHSDIATSWSQLCRDIRKIDFAPLNGETPSDIEISMPSLKDMLLSLRELSQTFLLDPIDVFMYEWIQQTDLPGGLNQLLLTSSLELLNRAFILSHPSNLPERLNKGFSESSKVDSLILLPSQSLSDQVRMRTEIEGVLGRVQSLMYLAGRNLRKSNIPTLIAIGNNLCYVSGWRDTRSVHITQLVD